MELLVEEGSFPGGEAASLLPGEVEAGAEGVAEDRADEGLRGGGRTSPGLPGRGQGHELVRAPLGLPG